MTAVDAHAHAISSTARQNASASRMPRLSPLVTVLQTVAHQGASAARETPAAIEEVRMPRLETARRAEDGPAEPRRGLRAHVDGRRLPRHPGGGHPQGWARHDPEEHLRHEAGAADGYVPSYR